MKKIYTLLLIVTLLSVLFAGCKPSATTNPISSEQPAGTETVSPSENATDPVETEPVSTEEDIVYEGDASSYYIDVVYADQIERYHTALTEKWDEDKYFDNNMSPLPYYYYEGSPLDNAGFGFVDLDNDGHWELIIGAILNAENDPAVFEIWTVVNGEPVMLVQGYSRNRYVLQYVEEDNMWYVVNEASNSAANYGTYYLMLSNGKLEVSQGIVYDAAVNEKNPWFMSYDMDWDVSNDTPIDEATANAILDSNRQHYTALELFPYIFYK